MRHTRPSLRVLSRAATACALLTVLLSVAPARADAVDDLHQAGLAAAERGDWAAAKQAWSAAAALLDHPDPRIEYELGTAHAQLDELGPAVLHLRIASELARDGELRRRAQLNLGIVRRRAELAAEATGSRVAPLEPWTERLVEIVASDLVAWLSAGLVLLASLAWIVSWRLAWRAADSATGTASSETTRARLQGLALAASVGAIFLLPAHVWSRAKADGVVAVVVVAGPTPLLDGPSPSRNTTATLAPGAEGWVDGSRAGWVHIVLRDKTQGWAPRATVEPIRAGLLGSSARSAELPTPDPAPKKDEVDSQPNEADSTTNGP